MEIDRALVHLSEMFAMRGEDTAELEEHAQAVLGEGEPRHYHRFLNEQILLNTDKTLVLFVLSRDTQKELFREWKDLDAEKMMELYQEEYQRRFVNYILVVQDNLTPGNASAIQARDKLLQPHGGSCQVFQMRELQYNPTKHRFVPKHEKMVADDITALMEQYSLKSRAQLPLIQRSDIIARWLGLRHGDVVRITRYNSTSGTYYYYRCCM